MDTAKESMKFPSQLQDLVALNIHVIIKRCLF